MHGRGIHEVASIKRFYDMYRRRKKMAERKWTVLWVMVFIVVAGLIPFGDARAASTGTPAGENVTLDGYNVTVVRDGGFPSLDGGNSVFKWNISGTANAKANVNTIDIKIPADVDPSYDHLRSSIQATIAPAFGSPCVLSPMSLKNLSGWALSPKGVGDLTTSIGRFEYDYYVLTIVPPKSCAITKTTADTKVQVKFLGKSLKSASNSFLVRASLFGESLNLLGPSFTGSGSSSGSGNPLVRNFESFQLGDHDCKMDVSLNADGSIASAVTRSQSEPNSTDPATTCYDNLVVESIRNTFLCDKNNCKANPDGSYTCVYPPPTNNCIKYDTNQYYYCGPLSSNYVCPLNSTTHLYECPGGPTFGWGDPIPAGYCRPDSGSNTCNITPIADSCAQNSWPDSSYVCHPTTPPAGCDSGACRALNCLPKTAVERNIIEQSGDNSKFCYNSTAGTQVCKTCTTSNTGVTKCVTQ
jgi:hypothetical protein